MLWTLVDPDCQNRFSLVRFCDLPKVTLWWCLVVDSTLSLELEGVEMVWSAYFTFPYLSRISWNISRGKHPRLKL